MDPITHGIAGALIGKAFFANRSSVADESLHAKRSMSTGRVAILAATVGAVFPDVDVFVDAFSHDPLAIARYHRGFTHSFVGLPIFAGALALLTRAFFSSYAKRPENEKWAPPSLAFLFGIYAAGIASHILLDGCTSFGTQMLNPFSKARVAWDLLFIVDFVLTALLLVPQLAAWVHRRRDGAAIRATILWIALTAAAVGVWVAARNAGLAFSWFAIVIAAAIFGAVLFVPLGKGNRLRFSRTQWCRVGFVLSCAYIVVAGIAHQAALGCMRDIATGLGLDRAAHVKIGAMPMPISLLSWNGLILTDLGVYQSQFSLARAAPPQFAFFANSPQNRFTREASQLEPVRTFLWFARFPVMHFTTSDGSLIVEYTDLRFFSGVTRDREPMPFTFYVSFDSTGKMLNYGWVEPELQFPKDAAQSTKAK